MNPGRFFRLDESTVTRIRRCYNLLVIATVYMLTILGLAILAVGFGQVMDWLATLVGLDDKTRGLLMNAGASLFVILILVSFLLALGDVIKLVRYYISDWGNDNDPKRPA